MHCSAAALRKKLNELTCADARSNKRDALDLAGKLPLAPKTFHMAIAPQELNIDPAQADGLLGEFDAVVCGASGLSKKGVRRLRGSLTVKVSRLRPGTAFEHFMLVLHQADPTDWTELHNLDNLFWLGYAPRAAFNQALAKQAVGTMSRRHQRQLSWRHQSRSEASARAGSDAL